LSCVVQINDGVEDIPQVVMRLLPGAEDILEVKLVNHGAPSNVFIEASGQVKRAVKLKKANYFVVDEELIPILVKMPRAPGRLDGEILVDSDESISRIPLSLVGESSSRAKAEEEDEPLSHPSHSIESESCEDCNEDEEGEEGELDEESQEDDNEDEDQGEGWGNAPRIIEDDDDAEDVAQPEEASQRRSVRSKPRAIVPERFENDRKHSSYNIRSKAKPRSYAEAYGYGKADYSIDDSSDRSLKDSPHSRSARYVQRDVERGFEPELRPEFQPEFQPEPEPYEPSISQDDEPYRDARRQPHRSDFGEGNRNLSQYPGEEEAPRYEESTAENSEAYNEADDEYDQAVPDRMSPPVIPMIMLLLLICVLLLTFYSNLIPEFPGAMISSILIVTLIIYGAATLLKA
jgi:hypothetical protein